MDDRAWALFELDTGFGLTARRMPELLFAAARVTLVSTGTLRSWDRRRFRAHVVLDGAGEDGRIGSAVPLGPAVLDVVRSSRAA